MSNKQDHNPVGDPCDKCGLSPSEHRAKRVWKTRKQPNRHHPYRKEHKPDGDPCSCGQSKANHRKRKKDSERWSYLGIDGEGQTNPDTGKHNYTMLCVADRNPEGRKWVLKAKPGESLSTKDCLDLILSLPTKRAKIFGYAFNYDLTKILTDVSDKVLWKLFRPDQRPRKVNPHMGPIPELWEGYSLNLQGTKFTVSKGRGRNKKRVVIWDIFKFFGCKFVNALRNWKTLHCRESDACKKDAICIQPSGLSASVCKCQCEVCIKAKILVDQMELMKKKRHLFDKEPPEKVEAYCIDECRCMAELSFQLIDAHILAGLKLQSYYGAGSSGGAMLTAMGIKEQLVDIPEEMRYAVSSAFFGGRFEHSVIGGVSDKLDGWDISSAYPYHTTFLPCLVHGKWSHTTDRRELDGARAACISYKLGSNTSITSWGPFPFREKSGNISYPIESGGGWVWLEEFLEGEKIFPHVHFIEAWVYSSDCGCQPFAAIPDYYLERIKLGKEGPGIVIKLGVNSVYGKLAQSIGSALFNNWIWAGMITSGCRAQILHMLGLHKDWSNLLMIATDGIYTREKLVPPTPKETGTTHTGKPLGGWERKPAPRGIFFARPGIYFPMLPTDDDLGDVKARGLGKDTLYDQWHLIQAHWEVHGLKANPEFTRWRRVRESWRKKVPKYINCIVGGVNRFCGGKTTISRHITKAGLTAIFRKKVKKKDAWSYRRSGSYGQWIVRENVMSFDPMPKRAKLMEDGFRLELRRFGKDERSIPYKKASLSDGAKMMIQMKMEAMEQPDAGDDETIWGDEGELI